MKTLLALILLVACADAAAQAPPAPTCYPPYAVNLTVGLQPASFTDWLASSSASFVVTWYCLTPAGTYEGHAIGGYRGELAPNWAPLLQSLNGSPKASFDALWNASLATENDPELDAPELAQLAATKPVPIKTTGAQVYYVIQQIDKFVVIPVGTAPIGTVCNPSESVGGMNGVPRAAVTWFGTVKPLSVVAPCG